ncbi:MAG: GntR family transcriptional regulator [Lentisphaeria bacterium]|nr:GntR family transcriptional regulator [Lentisphaeria bacterium]
MRNNLRHFHLVPQLYEELLRRIWSGFYQTGTQLPSVKVLQEELQLGKHTVEKAVCMLADDGYLKRHPGRAPLIQIPRNKNVLRLALSGMNTVGESQMHYEKSPRRWLFKEAVQQALKQHKCHCVGVFDRQQLNKVLPVLDGIVHFEFLDKPANPAPEVGKPVLTIKNMLESSLQENTVYVDRNQALEKVAYYMVFHGVKSVLSLQRGNDVLHNEREKQLERILTELGWAPGFMHSMVTEGVNEKHSAAPLKAFLAQNPQLPLGVLCQGDLLACGAAKTALAMEMQLKKDIVIIGCTGIPEAEHWRPAVSSLTSPFQAMGQCAAKSIIKLIKQKSNLPPQVVNGQLIIRET